MAHHHARYRHALRPTGVCLRIASPRRRIKEASEVAQRASSNAASLSFLKRAEQRIMYLEQAQASATSTLPAIALGDRERAYIITRIQIIIESIAASADTYCIESIARVLRHGVQIPLSIRPCCNARASILSGRSRHRFHAADVIKAMGHDAGPTGGIHVFAPARRGNRIERNA